MTQPGLGAKYLLGDEPNKMIPPNDTTSNEVGSLKDGNVFRHRVQGETVSSGQIGHARPGRGRELVEQPTTRSMTEREEDLVETPIRIFTHLGDFIMFKAVRQL
jgi:hypothetical protein